LNPTLPTGWRGRALALSIVFIVLAAFYTVAVAPFLDFYAANETTIETRRTLAARLSSMAHELPALRAQVANLRAAASRDQQTLEGGSDAVAAASLQGRIGEIAGSAGVMIASSEILPLEVQDGYRRLGLRIVVTGSYKGLIQLLVGVEKATLPLIIDNLQIRAAQRRPRAPAESVAPLDVSFEVFGFRPDETSGSAKQ
jgi:general secretion pathway protein M